MCRSIAEGGRRCPKCGAPHRLPRPTNAAEFAERADWNQDKRLRYAEATAAWHDRQKQQTAEVGEWAASMPTKDRIPALRKKLKDPAIAGAGGRGATGASRGRAAEKRALEKELKGALSPRGVAPSSGSCSGDTYSRGHQMCRSGHVLRLI